MKKTDIIVGVTSIIAIIATIFYLIESKLLFTAGKESVYAAGILLLFSVFVVFQHYIVIGLILRGRVKAFNNLANKYSLKHSHINKIFFIPYGKLNTLTGNIKGHAIEITDDSFLPDTRKTVKYVIINQIFSGYTLRKSLNMDTKIYIDGQNVTPDYPQSWILWRNPFMKMKFLEKYLAEGVSK